MRWQLAALTAAAMLGLATPASAQIVYCVPLGYPRGKFGPVTRKALEAVVSVDRWGTPLS